MKLLEVTFYNKTTKRKSKSVDNISRLNFKNYEKKKFTLCSPLKSEVVFTESLVYNID